MEVQLTIQERVDLEALLGAQRGTVAEGRALNKIIDKIELRPDEVARYGVTVVVDGPLAGSKRWNAEAGAAPPVAISLDGDEAIRVVRVLETWGGFTPADIEKWVDPLIQKFKA